MPRKKPSPAGQNDLPSDGPARAVTEAITPWVDRGRFAVERIAGDHLDVVADCFTELTHGSDRDCFRPHGWPDTRDILPESLQTGGRPAFTAHAGSDRDFDYFL